LNSDQERQKWDEIYADMPLLEEDEAMTSFNKEFLETITRILPPGSKTLEAGAGGGWQSLALGRSGKFDVTLCDFSKEALAYSSKIFERQSVAATFRQENVLDPGRQEFDLVFNSGVLEHYKLEEQVAFIRGMASRSRRYVLVLVPNRMCYWYWLWRIQKAGEGKWPYGKEVPLVDLSAAFKAAGLTFIGHKYLGADWAESFFQYTNDVGDDFRHLLLEIHRSPFIQASQKSYLLAGLGCVESESCRDLDGWLRPGEPEKMEYAELYASLGDALALRIGAENRANKLQKLLLEDLKGFSAEGEIPLVVQQKPEELARSLAKKNELAAKISLQNIQLVKSMEEQEQTIYLQQAELRSARRNSAVLEEIISSRAWRIVHKLWRLRLAIIPSNSNLERWLGWGPLKQQTESSVKADTAELDAILASYPDVRHIIIFPPSIEWDIHLFQRPQQMAMAFAQQNCLVFYCEPEYAHSSPGFWKIKDNLYGFKGENALFATISEPMVVVFSYNRDCLSYFSQPRVIYEYIDELSVFQKDLKKLEADHAYLIKAAKLVVATARRLYEKVRLQRPDAILCPNGVDYHHFHAILEPSQALPNPSDMQPILEEGKPIIGYYGALAHWFDYDLLKTMADLRPDWNFVLIGPDFDGSITKSGGLGKANVHWLGIRDYNDLPRYLKCFDVATIPFQVNEITHSTSPLKLFEYMAGGKPVVITPMEESMHTEGVLVGDGVKDFIQKVEQGLALRQNPGYLQLIDRVARENTWQKRAAQILEQFSKETPARES
jgi:glycosyltransferase involved in cell wall biosynthesis